MTRFMIGVILARIATEKDAPSGALAGASGSGSYGARFARRLKVLEVVEMDKKEYIERGALVEQIKNMPWKITPAAEISKGIFLQTVEDATTADVVSRGVFEQVKWERDMAMQQLEEHGIPFGAKADVVEVRHGEWEQQLRPYDDEIMCSVCGANFNIIDNCTEKFDYCPNCGAKMDGERKEQT